MACPSPLLLSLLLAAAPVSSKDPSGPALIAKFECQRCHDGLASVPAVPVERHCVHCHVQIEAGTFDAPAETQAGWAKNMRSLRFAPSLAEVGNSVDRAFIEDFIQRPHDLRPRLLASMPRFAITPKEAQIIAAFLTKDQTPAGPEPAPNADAIARGRAQFVALSCASCHSYSGVLPPPGPPTDAELRSASAAQTLAPDLRHTRARMTGVKVAHIVVSARAVRADALMPDFPISAADAADLAAFVIAAPLTPPAAPAKVERLPVLERKVAFAEIKARVFQKTCRHCHADPEMAFGDGGPGNTGGLGYKGKSLSLANYRSIQAGSRDEHGKRRSIFAPMPDGTPRIVAHLLARRVEEAGGQVDGVLGMPLGLPALSAEELQLIESWIAQGRPE